MHRLAMIAVAALLIYPSLSPAEEPPTKPQVEFGSGSDWPEGQATHVNGRIPEAAFGTWLIVENLDLSKDASIPALRAYRIQPDAKGQPQGELLSFSIPVEIQQQLETAQSATLRWEPKENDVPALLDAVRKTAAIDGKVRVKSYLDAADSMPEAIARQDKDLAKAYPGRKPTLFVIRFAAKTPSGELYSGNYFIEEVKPDMLRGAAKGAAVPRNSAGVPIPLSFNGNAKLLRVDPPAAAAAATPAGNAKPAS